MALTRKVPKNLKKAPPKPTAGTTKPAPPRPPKPKPKAPPKPKPKAPKEELPKQAPTITEKEGKTDGKATKAPSKQRTKGTGKEASKPVNTDEHHDKASEPRPASERPSEAKKEGQLTGVQVRDMPFKDRYELFKKLNTGDQFVTLRLRDDLPKQMVMREDEAKIRKLVKEKPKALKGTKTYYCLYCVDYTTFHSHAFTGYDRCIGCGMTSKDFYISADNDLFNKD